MDLRRRVLHSVNAGGRHLVDIIGDILWTKGVTFRGHFWVTFRGHSLGEFLWTFIKQ